MRILITGSNGFVGSPLSDRLEQIGHEIIRVQRRNKKEDFYIENIDGLIEWEKFLEGVDLVIHCAAKAHQTDKFSDNGNYSEINTEGTKNLALQAAKKGINKFIFISTIKVYGEVNKDNIPYSLNSKEQPIDSYGKSKLNAEKALYKIAEETNMQVIIIRCPLIYGPDVRANFLTLIKIVDKSLPLPFKSIKNKRSIIYLGNLISAIEKSIDFRLKGYQVFIFADKDPVSISEIIKLIAKSLNKKARLLYVPLFLIKLFFSIIAKDEKLKKLISDLTLDTKKSEGILNWQPPFDTSYGIDKTISHYLKNKKLIKKLI